MEKMETIIHPDYAYMKDFIEQLPHQFNQTGETLHDGRNKVKRFWVNQEPIIAKKYKYPNIIQRWVYTFFKKSKAERAYLYASILRERGFNTPHEIAFIQFKSNGLFGDSYFISTQTTDLPLLPVFKQKPLNQPMANKLAEYLVRLHQKGIMHGDLNLTNILYREENGTVQFSLIDTNRSQFIDSPSQAKCMENLKRLTHDKELLHYVVTQYATIRGWNKEECIQTVMQQLSLFEQKKQRSHRLKKIIRLK